ncbi:MAG TPA: pyridoxal phosphate-dependent aminotransferase family protein [Pirellulaceae bacterium]|nr:pyridoxal phosphate-dependent aminotransferase family protein [Pirellulaceae bacterium]
MNLRTEAERTAAGCSDATPVPPPREAVAAPANCWEPLKARLKRDKVTKLALSFLDRYCDSHLKDFDVDEIDDARRMRIGKTSVVNFGSDSFLGLDRDERLRNAMAEAAPRWGTHNGASRAFWSIALCTEAEHRLAKWLGVPDTLIYTSVTLANVGLLPALVAKGDLLVVDRLSHDSIQEGAKIAQANGATLRELSPCTPDALRALVASEPHKGLVVAVDGIYSMTGKLAPLEELDAVTRELGGTLYVDDAHGTGVVGPRGRGAANKVLGGLDRVLMVGSLSKAFSCLGAFVTCDTELKRILKIKSSTFIFGGPVPPPYLAAVIAACEILDSPEGDTLLMKLHGKIARLTNGLRDWEFVVLGEAGAIVSVLIGDIEKTFFAGKWLFDRGFYVQSATYPAVPITEGLLRIQVNANHADEDIDRLLAALGEMRSHFTVPRWIAAAQTPEA